MIISTGRNYIFVHIPKTGGTSLALALEGRAQKDDILIGDTPKAKRRKGRLKGVNSRGRLWKHSTLSDIDGLVSSDFISKAFTVTLVRNPWDRLLSYYAWLKDQEFDHPAVGLAKSLSFRMFLRNPGIQDSIRANPYESYMRMADGRLRASLYIRLENFSDEAAPLWEWLGFELPLPRENMSDRLSDYRDYYDDQSRDLVKMLCAEDIRRFDYSF